jgi:hypothetical protein
MSRSRLADNLIGISVLLICTVLFAADWLPLTGAPAPAQEQSNEMIVKPPQRAALRVAASVLESRLIHNNLILRWAEH